jgi:hypothetical protein
MPCGLSVLKIFLKCGAMVRYFFDQRNYGACGVADLQNNFIRAELWCVRILEQFNMLSLTKKRKKARHPHEVKKS